MTAGAEQPTAIRRHLEIWWCTVFFALTAVGLAVLLGICVRPLSLLTTAAVVLGALTMIYIGLRRYRPERPLPWYLLSVSAVLFAAATPVPE